MRFEDAKKLKERITLEEAQTVIELFDFETNLGNFNIQDETDIEIIYDITNKAVEKNFTLSEAYNFDTISYAIMAYLDEHDMGEFIDSIFPTVEDKLHQSVNYEFLQEIVELYNDLKSKYEI